MREKDYKGISSILIKSGLEIIVTKVSYERSLEPAVIYDYMKSLKPRQKIYKTDSVGEAVELFQSWGFGTRTGTRNNNNFGTRETGTRKTIIFTGSFFLVSDAIKELKLERKFKC